MSQQLDGVALPAPRAPRIVAFFCTWCAYTAADLAGAARFRYASDVRVVRVMCTGRVDPQFVLRAFEYGADGVLIGGCHPGDCHFVNGNYKALRRVVMLRRVLRGVGIAEERLRIEWISASEADRVRVVIDEMAEKLRGLEPLGLPSRLEELDLELREIVPQPSQAPEVAHG